MTLDPSAVHLPIPGTPPDPARTSSAFLRLVEVVARLRAPDGCPWDREQTLATIKPYTLEETYELLEAIDAGDDAGLVEELGDLLLQVLMYAQIGADEGRFDLIPVLESITEKMIRRHPHVFGEVRADSAEQVLHNWDRAKQKEKGRESALDGLPLALPALARSARLSSKVARAGLDLAGPEVWLEKLRGALQALGAKSESGMAAVPVVAMVDADNASSQTPEAVSNSDEALGSRQIGDLLFIVANLSRKYGINPEEALRESNRRFELRFRALEQRLAAEGRTAHDTEREELY